MDICSRCHQVIRIEDHKARGNYRRIGSPGLHVRRHLCACGCKAVQFYTVMNVSLMRTRSPRPDRVDSIPLNDFPIFQDTLYGRL